MLVRNAIVPVAGMGTRLLPSTKSQPKEMLSVGRKPVVQYVFEELAQGGIGRVLFVTGRGKHTIEDHFDPDPELRQMLEADKGKRALLKELDFEQHNVRIFYTRQSEARGLGDAILHGRAFAEGSPFVVALGDSIIMGHNQTNIITRLIECFERFNARCVIALEEVPHKEVFRYGIAEPVPNSGGEVFELRDLVEKPKPEKAPSNLAIAGRYVMSAEIFDVLERTKPGKNNEVQLTDAIRTVLKERGGVYGVKLAAGEKRYDIGNIESYFRSFVELALRDPDYGAGLRKYLKGLLQ